MKKERMHRTAALLLSAALCTGTLTSPLLALSPAAYLMEEQTESDLVSGSVKRAPATADLAANGNLDWVHMNNKDQSAWAGAGNGLISDITLTGTLAQIMTDTDTNFVYPGSAADNHRGQVINQQGGKTTFSLPASTDTRYVSVFTGSWASTVELRVLINGEVQYSNRHGKQDTSNGAESFITRFSYHTLSEDDTVTVEIETVEVLNSTYGNHSIQAIVLSDTPQDYGLQEGTGTVEMRNTEAPELASLSRQGQLDWVVLDSTDFGSFNRKNTDTPGITSLQLIGNTDYVTQNTRTGFVYADGLSPAMQNTPQHKGLVFTGTNKGISFQVPGSTETRTLNIYAGAWAARIKVTMEVNGVLIGEKTFESTDTTAGTPAKYTVFELDYSTDSAEDEVKVTVVTDKQYDTSWGNMNISGITLGSERLEETGNLVSAMAKNAPGAANLSQEGKLDWAYFNHTDLDNYARKKNGEGIENITLLGQRQSDPLTRKVKTGFFFEDGVDQNGADLEPVSDEHLGNVFLHEGSGLEWTLPASTDLQYVNVYVGAWAAEARFEVLVNGKLETSTLFGSSSTVPDTTKYQVVRMAYQCASPDDTVTIRAVVDKAYDPAWGNINISAITLSDEAPASAVETLKTDHWNVNHSGGEISSLQCMIGGEMTDIPVRPDSRGGVAWKINGRKVMMNAMDSDGDSLVYSGRLREGDLDLGVTLSYSISEDDSLDIRATLKNNKEERADINRASLQLGFNTYLESYPDYNDQLFPTLLRCEKTHLWGYFTSPSGKIMTIATDAPVASYTLDYESGQHRIYTASLDLLQAGQLPERHPEGMDHLEAGEEKSWTVSLKPAAERNDPSQVKDVIARSSDLPMMDADRYTLDEKETSQITIQSQSELNTDLELTAPDGTISTLQAKKGVDGQYHAAFDAKDRAVGVYTLKARNAAGYIGEMKLTIRNPWSWYTQMARKASVEARQKGSSHAETFYGFYSAYIAKKYFPDTDLDIAVDEMFEEVYPLMYDPATGDPTSWANRIQNHSTTMGIFVDMYESSGNEQALASGEHLADFLLKTQKADGGYYNGNTDYTSVIYPAKSIMELTKVEKRLMNDETKSEEVRSYNRERYELHMASLAKAMDKLVRVDGNFDTEGQGTYEDGANSCSVTQLSEFALMFEEGSAERQKYAEAAEKYLTRHTSHQQSIIPDSRMNGGTLRFWEAQYDVEMGLTSGAPNMMNSPHGWSAWNIYGLFNLYELTGNVDYLERGMNAMGSCAQLMGFDGTLRWAFIADPYRETRLFVQDEEKTTEDKIVGKHVDTVIGEQYVDMISYWWKAPAHTWVPGYTAMGGSVTQGACCDNDVHEVFKALGEVALTKAYVVEQEDGSLEAYNCTAQEENGSLVITPDEDVVSNISLQLKKDRDVTVHFWNGDQSQTIEAGLPVWMSTAENCVDIESLDKEARLDTLQVENAALTEDFDPEGSEFSVSLPENTASATILASASEGSTIYINGNRVENNQGFVLDLARPMDVQDVIITVKSPLQSASKTYILHVDSLGDNEIVDPAGMTVTTGSYNPDNGTEGPAAYAVDGNTSTLWHTRWSGGTVGMEDRWIQFDLEEAREISGLRYLPRSSGQNGNILGWEIWTSTDHGETWTTAASGNWANETGWKMASFEPAEVTTVRLVPTQTHGEYASAAEIRLVAAKDATPSKEANKTLLAMAITQAEALDQEETLKGVNELVVQNFHQRLEEARTVMADASASQEEVNNAWKALCQAIHMLSFTTDKTELAALIAQAQSLLDNNHSQNASRNALEEALAYAQSVMDDPAALDDQSIAEAVSRLKAAIEGFEPDAQLDTSLLEFLLEQTTGIDESLYMSQSLEEFHAAREHAQSVLDSPEDDAQIQTAVTRLHTAWLNLRLKADENLLQELAGLKAELETFDLQVLSADQADQVVFMMNRMNTIMKAPETEAREVEDLIDEARDLLDTLPEEARTKPADKPEDSLKPEDKPAEEQKTTPDNNKPKTDSSTSKSVKTASVLHAGFFGSLLAAAAGTLLISRRKNRK